MSIRQRCGLTFVELLVTLALIGIMSAVATPALLRPAAPDASDPDVIARRLRSDAVRSGVAKSGVATVKGVAVALTAYPDGSVIADSSLRIDPLTGRVTNATP